MTNLEQASELIKMAIECDDTLDSAYETYLAFHKLWTADVGAPGYDKSDWKKLDTLLASAMAQKYGHNWVTAAAEARKHAAAVAAAEEKNYSVATIELQEMAPETRELMETIFTLLRGKSVEVGINVLLNVVINIVKQTGGQFEELKEFFANMIDVHKAAGKTGQSRS